MPDWPSLNPKNAFPHGRPAEKAEAHEYELPQTTNTGDMAASALAAREPDFDEIGSDATGEWALRTLARFDEIWAGYTLTPAGWSDWRMRVGVDHTGMRAVTACAIRQTGGLANVSFTIADMVSPLGLNDAIQDFFGDLKRAPNLRDVLGHLACQPTPVLPDWLLAQLEEDVADDATQRFNEARAVLGVGRQCSRSMIASR